MPLALATLTPNPMSNLTRSPSQQATPVPMSPEGRALLSMGADMARTYLPSTLTPYLPTVPVGYWPTEQELAAFDERDRRGAAGV